MGADKGPYKGPYKGPENEAEMVESRTVAGISREMLFHRLSEVESFPEWGYGLRRVRLRPGHPETSSPTSSRRGLRPVCPFPPLQTLLLNQDTTVSLERWAPSGAYLGKPYFFGLLSLRFNPAGSRWAPEVAAGDPTGHDVPIMESSAALHVLRTFRHSFYECLHRRSDALFELVDAILTADSAGPSPAHLSLQAPHRRGWGSLYAALNRGWIDAGGSARPACPPSTRRRQYGRSACLRCRCECVASL